MKLKYTVELVSVVFEIFNFIWIDKQTSFYLKESYNINARSSNESLEYNL